MNLKRLEMHGFKSFAKKTVFQFTTPITAIVGPNGSGKSNVVESIRFVMGEQSMKSLRGKAGADLIFKGSHVLPKGSRAGVTLVFDNRDHQLQYTSGEGAASVAIDTDEVAIAREVYPDGSNKYLINGTEVRLKDVVEVLASAFIGSKAHNIISQGEADHLLNAHPKERKEMLEEALGLKLFHVRMKEAQRKLEKAQENLRESDLLRRELAPHLKFLKKQVERLEAAKHIREELLVRVSEYVSREQSIVQTLHAKAVSTKEQAVHALHKVRADIGALNETLSAFSNQAHDRDLADKKAHLARTQQALDELSRQLGRIEGMLAFAAEEKPQQVAASEQTVVPVSRVKQFIERVTSDHVGALLSATSLDQVKSIARQIADACSELAASYATAKPEEPKKDESRIVKLQQEKTAIEKHMAELGAEIAVQQEAIMTLEQSMHGTVDEVRSLERQLREASIRESELHRDLEQADATEMQLRDRQSACAQLVDETMHMCAVAPTIVVPVDTVEDSVQIDALRAIERLKIRLEDMGGGSGGDVMQEYQETEARDRFLEKEITDATNSVATLVSAIDTLKVELARQFDGGLAKVDSAFQDLFTAMFGGGKAKLNLVAIEKRKRKSSEGEDAASLDEDQDDTDDEDAAPTEYGVEVAVQLPRKKTTEIEMLSGGERSLTSIALLFALTQVEPPPFLILDETDAALDEANSRRYADLLVELSNHSQLIVVTHNRETMTAAQTLYGVTLGSDDASEVLSVQLEKAVQYAK